MKKLMCFVVLCLLAFFGYSTYQMEGFVIDHSILGAMAGVVLMIGSTTGRAPSPAEGAKKRKKATPKKKGRAAA